MELSLFALSLRLEDQERFVRDTGIENEYNVEEVSMNEDLPTKIHYEETGDHEDTFSSGFERGVEEARAKATIEAEETKKAHDSALAEAKAVTLDYEKAKTAAEYEVA